MASFFSRLKAAFKAAAQAFREQKPTPPKATPPKATPPKATPPKATPPKATPPKATPPKATPPKQKRTKAERVTRLQEITLNKNRDAASTFYAATVKLWNVPEGTTEARRNQLIIDKLGVSDLKEAYDIVMTRFRELNSGDVDDSTSPPPRLTQLQTEIATRVSGHETD